MSDTTNDVVKKISLNVIVPWFSLHSVRCTLYHIISTNIVTLINFQFFQPRPRLQLPVCIVTSARTSLLETWQDASSLNAKKDTWVILYNIIIGFCLSVCLSTCRWKFFFLFFLNFWRTYVLFVGPLITPVLDFWWRLMFQSQGGCRWKILWWLDVGVMTSRNLKWCRKIAIKWRWRDCYF